MTQVQIKIRQLTTADNASFTKCLDLLNRTQGQDLFAPDYLTERTADPDSFVLAAFQEEEIVGIAVAQIISDFSYYRPFCADITAELEGKIVGSFATMCIHESLQGKGIGKQLAARRLEWLRQKKCDVILGVSWVSGLAHTSNRVFEKSGFRAVKKVENFYHQSSIDKPFYCPGCRAAPCTCAAILYRRDF